MQNSLEWAISAAASIGIHFLDDGFGIEIYEADGPLHQRNDGPAQPSVPGIGDQPTDRPCTRRPPRPLRRRVRDRGPAGPAGHRDHGANERAGCALAAPSATQSGSGPGDAADVDTFADEPASEQQAQHDLAGQILRDNQWRVIDVPRGGVADAWSALEQLNTAA